MATLMSQTAYGKHRGISQARVSQLVKARRLDAALVDDGRYTKIDRDKADIILDETLDTKHNKNRASKSPAARAREELAKDAATAMKDWAVGEDIRSLTVVEAQRRRAIYDAELKRLDFEVKSGKLVEVDVVRKDTFELARRTRDAILAIPDRISAELASDSNRHSVRDKMFTELTAALEEISQL